MMLKLFDDIEIIVLIETHFGVRSKCPPNYVLIARSKPRESKIPRGGTALFKRKDSTLEFNILSDDMICWLL